MRAIVVREFGSPDVMRLEDIALLTPSPSQVLVRVRAAGVNPVDTYVRTGTYALKPSLPYTPGNDGAGEVEAIGADVKGFKNGDRVYIANDNTRSPRTGVYADHALCAPSQLHHLPDSVSFSQGAAIGVPYGTACYALFKRAMRPARRHRAGARRERWRGHRGRTNLPGAWHDRHRNRRDRSRHASRSRQGAHVVLNHKDPGYLEEVPKATGGRGVDVILEMNAHLNLDKDLPLLSRSGRIVLIGSRGRVEIDPRGIMGREASVLGMVLFNVAAADLGWMHAAIGAGLANGTLKPVVGREIPLADAPKAHEAVMAPGALGKIVLVP